jgi:uncharacterized membrane protein
VDLYSWLLAFHLLAAFALAAGMVLYAVLVVVGRRATTLAETQTLFRVAPVGAPLTGAGAGLALALGIALAIDSDQFEIWNGWVIAALVLWALMGWVGSLTGKYYTDVQKRAEAGEEQEVLTRLRAPRGALLHTATMLIFLVLLLDMIFKPGA